MLSVGFILLSTPYSTLLLLGNRIVEKRNHDRFETQSLPSDLPRSNERPMHELEMGIQRARFIRDRFGWWLLAHLFVGENRPRGESSRL